MRGSPLILALLLGASFASNVFAQTKNPPLVAAYDRLLADVAPGQTTLTFGDMLVPVEVVRAWRDRLALCMAIEGW